MEEKQEQSNPTGTVKASTQEHQVTKHISPDKVEPTVSSAGYVPKQ